MRSLVHLAAAVAAAVAVVATSTAARAADLGCPIPSGASADLADASGAERMAFVRSSLVAERASAEAWTYGWAGAGVALAGAQVTWAALGPRAYAGDHLVGAGFQLLTPLTLVLAPPRVLADAGAVDALAQGGFSCANLALAEAYFARDAEGERRGQAFAAHAIPLAGAVIGASIAGLAAGHWDSAALTLGTGVVLTELRILTQPTGVDSALTRYRQGVLVDGASHVAWSVAPFFPTGGAGIGAAITF